MRILITGASGFIGRRALAQLNSRHEVVAVVRDLEKAEPAGTLHVVAVDLTQQLPVNRLPPTIDVILHLAQANVPFPDSAGELFAVNTIAVQQLLDYGRLAGARQFILVSTGDVYGRRLGASKETDAVNPATYYAATKYAAELLAQAYSDYFIVCVLRLYHPYGPGQVNRLIPGLAERIRRREPVTLNIDDHPHITPIYIDDVTCAIERAIERCFAGIMNIAGNRVVSLRELSEEIGRILEIEPVFRATDERSSDFIGDNNLMRRVLGDWTMVALQDGLSHTFRSEGARGWHIDV